LPQENCFGGAAAVSRPSSLQETIKQDRHHAGKHTSWGLIILHTLSFLQDCDIDSVVSFD